MTQTAWDSVKNLTLEQHVESLRLAAPSARALEVSALVSLILERALTAPEEPPAPHAHTTQQGYTLTRAGGVVTVTRRGDVEDMPCGLPKRGCADARATKT